MTDIILYAVSADKGIAEKFAENLNRNNFPTKFREAPNENMPHPIHDINCLHIFLMSNKSNKSESYKKFCCSIFEEFFGAYICINDAPFTCEHQGDILDVAVPDRRRRVTLNAEFFRTIQNLSNCANKHKLKKNRRNIRETVSESRMANAIKLPLSKKSGLVEKPTQFDETRDVSTHETAQKDSLRSKMQKANNTHCNISNAEVEQITMSNSSSKVLTEEQRIAALELQVLKFLEYITLKDRAYEEGKKIKLTNLRINLVRLAVEIIALILAIIMVGFAWMKLSSKDESFPGKEPQKPPTQITEKKVFT